MSTIRGSSITTLSFNPFVIPFPAGSAVGDLALIFIGSAFAVSGPGAPWVSFAPQGPPIFWNGNSMYKVLDAGDLSTGHVTATTGGDFPTVIAMVVFVGDPGMRRGQGFKQVPPTSPNPIAQTTTPAVGGDYAVYFGSNRGAADCSFDVGTQIQAINATNGSGCVYFGVVPSGFVSANFSNTVDGSGAYEAIWCTAEGVPNSPSFQACFL